MRMLVGSRVLEGRRGLGHMHGPLKGRLTTANALTGSTIYGLRNQTAAKNACNFDSSSCF